MARPRCDTRPIVVNVKLYLYEGLDDDLIAFFQSIPKGGRAQAVAIALRDGMPDVVQQENAEDLADAFDSMLY